MNKSIFVRTIERLPCIRINFNPENTKGEKLTSRALKEDCIFTFGYLVESEVRIVNGKQRRFQKKTPLSYVMAPVADNAGGGGNGGTQSGDGTNQGGGTNTGGNGDDDDERPGAGG